MFSEGKESDRWLEMDYKKVGVLKFEKLTGKLLCQSLFFHKGLGLSLPLY